MNGEFRLQKKDTKFPSTNYFVTLIIHNHSCQFGSSLLHDRSLSSVAGDESRMAGGESRMTGDCCRPEVSIHRCVRTHSHLYSYIYGLVALLDNIQSSFSKYHYLNIAWR